MDTITAIATPGCVQGAISMIRLSGPESWKIAKTLLHREEPFEAGKIAHGWIREGENLIDEVITIPYRSPNSYTGEDVIEFCGHGGVWVTQRVLQACLSAGARLAHPGEFTQRALMNGKLDLTQAESVLDLIHAQGDALLQAATQNLRYRTLGVAIERLAAQITTIQGQIVASIDFPEEVEEPDRSTLLAQAQIVLSETDRLLVSAQRAAVVRNGLRVALLGQPNAGKSSLFNALLTEDRAIVTPIAGTTRDTLNETLTIAGIPVTLIDTAGLRAPEHAQDIEKIGIERSWQAAAEADLWLYVVDAASCTNGILSLQDAETLAALRAKHPETPVAVVVNKIDCVPDVRELTDVFDEVIALSALNGEGLPRLLSWLRSQIDRLIPTQASTQGDARQAVICLTQRQSETLGRAQSALVQTVETLQQVSLPLDLVTVSLSESLHAFGSLLGTDSVEAVLDDVFSRFCVGK